MKRFIVYIPLLFCASSIASNANAQTPTEGLVYIYNTTGAVDLPLSDVVAGPARTSLLPINCNIPKTSTTVIPTGSIFDSSWTAFIGDPTNVGMFCRLDIPKTLANGQQIPTGTYRFVLAYSIASCNIGGQVFTPCDGARLLVTEPSNFLVNSLPTNRPVKPTAGFVAKIP